MDVKIILPPSRLFRLPVLLVRCTSFDVGTRLIVLCRTLSTFSHSFSHPFAAISFLVHGNQKGLTDIGQFDPLADAIPATLPEAGADASVERTARADLEVLLAAGATRKQSAIACTYVSWEIFAVVGIVVERERGERRALDDGTVLEPMMTEVSS